MARTPAIVLMTVGHIEQTAIANSAAGSDFWKMIRPSGSQASGEIGRMHLHDRVEHPRQRRRHAEQEAERGRDRDPEQEPARHAHEAVVGEQQDALVHLAALGERLEDVEPALAPRLQRRRQVGNRRGSRRPRPARPTPMPHSGSRNSGRGVAGASSDRLDRERQRVLVRIAAVERAVEQRDLLLLLDRDRVAHLLHRFQVQVRHA